MNTYPDTTTRPPAPFAAKINFKPKFLYQKKHPTWTFRSDQFTFQNAAPAEHLKALEAIIKEHSGQFITASIFDNRLKPYVSDFPGKQANNLVFQVCYQKIWIDKRRDLDLSFMDYTFDAKFIQYLAQSFTGDYYDDQLQRAAGDYKKVIYGR